MRVVDDLHSSIKAGDKLSIAAASFSIYAYEALKNELESIDELRFIFTSWKTRARVTPRAEEALTPDNFYN